MTEESTTEEPPTLAGRREWLGLTVLALPTLLLSLDMSVLYIALPTTGVRDGGMEVTTVGLLLITAVDSVGGLPLVVTGLVLACTGVGPISSLGNGIVLASAPPEKAGSASSISETAAALGFALGVAVLGTIGAAVYRSRLSDSLDAGLPAEAVRAARESIAGAHSAAAQLPVQVGADLLSAARDAFTAGLNVVAGISAALFLVLAVVTLMLFRHLPVVREPEPATDQA